MNALAEHARWQDRRWRLPTAFVLGAVLNFGFAPFGYFLPCLIAVGGLLVLMQHATEGREAFWTGWFFGWGHFIAGLYWIASAFLVEPEKFAWMIPFPVLGLPAVLAIFPALAVWAAFSLAPPGPWRVITFAATWTLAEMARGSVLTGFPWNLVGYIFHGQAETMQPVAWIGIYGLSFLAMLGLGAIGTVLIQLRHWGFAISVVALLGFVFFATAQRIPAVMDTEGQFTARIVQANIAQRDKWRPDRILGNFQSLIELSRPKETQEAVDVVIWPETAATFRLESEPAVREAMGATVRGVRGGGEDGLIVTGAPSERLVEGVPRYFNSAHVIKADGSLIATADKHHLVPFGEYLPLRWVLQQIGLERLAQGRGDFSPGPPGQILRLPGMPDAALLICYEAIFPSRAMRDVRPGWILNLTNDGWFGELTGPDHHFMMSRFRAVEQGIPLVRAAGTGISGVVDPFGRVVDRLELGRAGALSIQVPNVTSVTLFSETGSLPVLFFCVFLGLVIGLARYRDMLP